MAVLLASMAFRLELHAQQAELVQKPMTAEYHFKLPLSQALGWMVDEYSPVSLALSALGNVSGSLELDQRASVWLDNNTGDIVVTVSEFSWLYWLVVGVAHAPSPDIDVDLKSAPATTSTSDENGGMNSSEGEETGDTGNGGTDTGDGGGDTGDGGGDTGDGD